MKKSLCALFVIAIILALQGIGFSEGQGLFYHSAVFAEEISPDTEPPSIPDNLRYTEVTSNAAEITWDDSTDNVGVAGYEIYIGGTLYETVTESVYTVTSLSPETEYAFTVKAKDAADNISEPSNELVVVTKSLTDTEPPSIPENLRCLEATAYTAEIAWDDSTDNVGVAGYEIYIGGTLYETVTESVYTVTGLSPETEYTFRVKAKDSAGNISDSSSPLTVNTLFLAPSFTEPEITDTSIKLAWNGIPDAEQYEIDVDGTIINNGNLTNYLHSGLIAGSTHIYRVRGMTSYGYGEWSEPLSVTTFANINVSGTISANTTWTYGHVYSVQANLTVAQGVQLDIEPGVLIKVKPVSTITIYGKVNVIGTENRKIVITSSKDKDYGGTGVAALADYWGALLIKSTGELNTNYADIKYGGNYTYNNNYRGVIPEGKLNINNSDLHHFYKVGVYINSNKDIIINNSRIEYSGSAGIYINSIGNATFEISNNIISNNIGNAICVNLAGLSFSIFNDIYQNTYLNNSYNGISYNGVGLEGTPIANILLTKSNPYTLVNSFTIPQNLTFTIEKGVLVKYDGARSITVNGNFYVNGTIQEPVIFTSVKDPQYGGTGVSVQGDYWGAIIAGSTGKIYADNIKVFYAAYSGSSIAISTNSDFILTNSEISKSRGRGISIDSFGSGILNISNNIIKDNKAYAIYVNLNNLSSSIFSGISQNTYINNVYAGGLNDGVKYDSVHLEGTLKTNLSLDSSAGMYTSKNITIPLGFTLTLQPGAVVKSDYTTNKIQVDGVLNAIGTVDNPVVLTAIRDASYGGSGITSYNHYWNGILVNATGEFNGNYTKIRYAGWWDGEKSIELKGKLNLNNSSIYASYSYGIAITGNSIASVKNTKISSVGTSISFSSTSSGSFDIEDSVLENSRYGLAVYGNSNVSMINSKVSGMGLYGIYINPTGAGNLTIKGNTVENSGSHGVYTGGFGTGNFTFENNTIINSKGYAFLISLSGLNSSIFGGIANNSFINNIDMGRVYNGITLGGSPNIDILLTKNDYYFGQETLNIAQNRNFIVSSGVSLRFLNWASGLTVNGKITAHGTAEEPIVFTSFNDPANPNYIVSGDYWKGMDISSTGEVDGDYIKVRNADGVSDSNINVKGKLILSNSEITNSYNKGINFDTVIQPVLLFNTFKNNAYAVNNARPAEITIDASYNYWNSLYGPGYNRNRVSSGVTYTPWLGLELKYNLHNGGSGVYAPTGNYSRSFTDLSLKSPGFDINLARTYNARDDRQDRPFGTGWSFSYEGSIKDYSPGVPIKVVRLPDGSVQAFTKNDNGTYTE